MQSKWRCINFGATLHPVHFLTNKYAFFIWQRYFLEDSCTLVVYQRSSSGQLSSYVARLYIYVLKTHWKYLLSGEIPLEKWLPFYRRTPNNVCQNDLRHVVNNTYTTWNSTLALFLTVTRHVSKRHVQWKYKGFLTFNSGQNVGSISKTVLARICKVWMVQAADTKLDNCL